MRMWNRLITTAVIGAIIALCGTLGTSPVQAHKPRDTSAQSLFPEECLRYATVYYNSLDDFILSVDELDQETQLRDYEVIYWHAWGIRDSAVAFMRSSTNLLNCILIE